jgi:hypothetical protein
MTEAKNTMTIGADGEVMHSLHAGKSGTITVNAAENLPGQQKAVADVQRTEPVLATWGITSLSATKQW